MRDIVITAIIVCSLPFILRSPSLGSLMWVWVSVMNPHTQGWGFAARLPFAYMIALATFASLLFSRAPKSLPLTPVSCALIALTVWMNVTMPFALLPAASLEQWGKVMKIMLMTFVVLITIREKKEVQRLVWVLVISIGYYGVKGGIFTIRSGGKERVWGPDGTFIGDNNEIALALIITIPLMYYVQQTSSGKWVRRALTVAMLLCALAAIGTYSRGALLAIAAMAVFMWSRSGNKLTVGLLMALAATACALFMPSGWGDRMDTISNYEADDSAQGRINAWQMAFNLACDRFFGGGFEVSDPTIFLRYAPNPRDVHAAHSIYFQMLGEHGFVGLGLYLLLWAATWRSAAWIVRNGRQREDLRWAVSLATMIQASAIGFAVGGAFLSLVYFDMPYYLMVAIISTRIIVARELALAPQVEKGAGAAPVMPSLSAGVARL
jgi:probable O-glycosylation ligase (exosortase A-associated)